MKLRCACDEIIVDQTDRLPYKAHFRSDEDEAEYLEVLTREVERVARAFASAPAASAERQLKTDLEEFGMMGVSLERPMYECPKCGRLLLVRNFNPSLGTAVVHVFAPEAAEPGLLRSTRTRDDAG